MDTNELYLFIGRTIRTIRKAKHITLSDMAHDLNKSVSTLSKYENGQLFMGINDLLDICRLLSIDVRTLLPGTETEENDSDIQRYRKYFISRLYLYYYSGQRNQVQSSVILNDNTNFHSLMYFNVKNISDFYNCSYIYDGTVEYSDSNMVYVMKNVAQPFDTVMIRIPTLAPVGKDRVGLMSTISSYYQSLALKVLVTESPVRDLNSLIPKLKITKDELREISRENFFIVQ